METYNISIYSSSYLYQNINAPRPEILFMSASLLSVVIIRSFLKFINAKFPMRAVILIAGALTGLMAKANPGFGTYITISSLNLQYFLTIFIPIFIFNGVFKINQAVFYKNKWQIMVLAIPNILINCGVLACIMKASAFKDWYWSSVFIYSIICSPIDAQEVISLLHDSPLARYIQVFLEGESYFGEVFSIYLIKCLLYRQIECVPNKESLNLGWQWIVGGIIFGYIIGNVIAFIVVHSSNSITAISVIISSFYIILYATTYIINISGDISIAIVSMVIAKNQFKMEKKIRQGISQFWKQLSFIGSSLLLIVASCAISKYSMNLVKNSDVSSVVMSLFTLVITRAVVVLILSPLLSRMNGGFTMRQATVVILSFGRSTLSIALSMLLVQFGTKDGKAAVINVHAFLLLLLTSAVVGAAAPYILQRLQLSEPPLSKKNHFTHCLKRLEKLRDRTIAVLKIQTHMTDVNWTYIENGTSIDHPYNISIEECEEAEDQDFSLAFISTYCPRCQVCRPREISDSILIAMRREAKSRILKAKRISYRKQYQDGLLSLEALMALLHMIDEAELSSDFQLKTDWIESIWKPKSSTMNIRQRLITILIQDEPEPLWPDRSCRHTCYQIATSSTFNFFMYTAIVLNSILIVSDISIPEYRSRNATILFQLGHILFYFLLMLELAIKIAGYTCDGYLNSKWNQVEFVVFFMASFDEMLLLLGLVFLVDLDELFISSSWLRTLRLIRLLKLTRILAPKVVMTIDSHMDGRMLEAYEIGKGFIIGEDEVLEILHRLIDDETLRIEIRKEMENDRNEAHKQMLSLQKNRSWLATSVRTRHTIKHVLLTMKRTVEQMKNEGLLEKVEYKKLSGMIEEKYHEVQRSSKYTHNSPAKTILRSVYWLTGDDESLSYLHHRSRPTFLGPGHTVLHPGQNCPSVHIILSGVLVTFANDGTEISLVPGDCVGLIEFLTGKPVEYSTTTISSAQLCTFPGEHLRSCMLATGPTSTGLESRMWTYAAQMIAVNIVRELPGYKDCTRMEVQKMLDRSFVPGLETFKKFEVTDIIEHIILIHGQIMDHTTKEIFFAPCYIPRTIHYLALPNINEAYSQSLYPKLVIVPAEEADEFETQEREDGVTHVVGLTACRCLRHRASSGLVSRENSSGPIPPRRKVRGFRRPMVRQTQRSDLFNLSVCQFDAVEANPADTEEINNDLPVEAILDDLQENDDTNLTLLFEEKT